MFEYLSEQNVKRAEMYVQYTHIYNMYMKYELLSKELNRILPKKHFLLAEHF